MLVVAVALTTPTVDNCDVTPCTHSPVCDEWVWVYIGASFLGAAGGIVLFFFTTGGTGLCEMHADGEKRRYALHVRTSNLPQIITAQSSGLLALIGLPVIEDLPVVARPNRPTRRLSDGVVCLVFSRSWVTS